MIRYPDRVNIHCPRCGLDGTISVDGGQLQPTLGFVLADMNTPFCRACDAPAGISHSQMMRWSYDVGPLCPEDDLSQRLDDCRAAQRANPIPLTPLRRW